MATNTYWSVACVKELAQNSFKELLLLLPVCPEEDNFIFIGR